MVAAIARDEEQRHRDGRAQLAFMQKFPEFFGARRIGAAPPSRTLERPYIPMAGELVQEPVAAIMG